MLKKIFFSLFSIFFCSINQLNANQIKMHSVGFATETISAANPTETLFEKISASTLRLQTLCVDSDPESYSEITILIDEILKLAVNQINNKQTGSVAIAQANLARTQMIQLAKTIAQKADKTHKLEIVILYRELQPVFGWSNVSGKQFISIFNKARIAAKYKFYEQNLLRVAKIAAACLACEKTFALIFNFGNTLHNKEKQNTSENSTWSAVVDKLSTRIGILEEHSKTLPNNNR